MGKFILIMRCGVDKSIGNRKSPLHPKPFAKACHSSPETASGKIVVCWQSYVPKLSNSLMIMGEQKHCLENRWRNKSVKRLSKQLVTKGHSQFANLKCVPFLNRNVAKKTFGTPSWNIIYTWWLFTTHSEKHPQDKLHHLPKDRGEKTYWKTTLKAPPIYPLHFSQHPQFATVFPPLGPQ